ncbi:unnamed protein product [Peniophora sp. CBMAI 1063]|nr:unnamed protein product [Peniophora sp. CBMAI 1063]
MPKAPRVSMTKSPRKTKASVNEDANIAVEAFKSLVVANSFTQAIASSSAKGEKHTFKTGQFARFLGAPLMNLSRSIEPWEWWVGQIIDIRRANTGNGYWLCVQWLWSRDEIQAEGVKSGDPSCMGRWERSSCQSVKGQDFVHSATIDGPADVRPLNEHVHFLPDVDVFYIRSAFRLNSKQNSVLEFTEKEVNCKCADCGIGYNPDDALVHPLRFCANCKVWCHSDCREGGRLVQSTRFANIAHHAKGLLLAGLGETAHPGPQSQKSAIIANRARQLDLAKVRQCLPRDLAKSLVDIAQQRIVRPLPGNIAGNIAYVLRAREWIREAHTSGVLSQSRRKILKQWFEELTEAIDLEDILAPDTREEAQNSALYVCQKCDHPI